jgi:hypothetical protein
VAGRGAGADEALEGALTFAAMLNTALGKEVVGGGKEKEIPSRWGFQPLSPLFAPE